MKKALLLFFSTLISLFGYGQKKQDIAVASNIDQTIPDSPVGFGYKCMWFALKTNNPDRIAQMLKLKHVASCNWKVGIDSAYNSNYKTTNKGSVFITPTIDGWTLACGWGVNCFADKRGKKVLQALSKEFGEAQFFFTDRRTETHCWMIALNGQMKRLVSFYNGELVIEGTPTDVEKPLKFIDPSSKEAEDEKYFERKGMIWVNEDIVMKIAANWSIDPTLLDQRKDIPPALGLLGQQR